MPSRGEGSEVMAASAPRSRARYAFAVFVTAVGIAVTLVVTRRLEDFPLIILLAAVMARALRGGTGPGFVATTMSAAAILGASHFLAAAFAIPPVNLGDEVVRLVIFVSVASGISLIAGARRRAERERDVLLVREQAARAEAEAASLAKDEFLAMVSHELRNPLAAILAWSTLLQDECTAEMRRRAAGAIERSAKAQSRLVDDLLDVSRIVRGKLRLDLCPMDLVPVIEAAVDTVRPAADAKRITIHIALDPSAGLVRGDAARLRQVVWNLVSNAVKFTPEGGRVRVGLAIASRAEISVSDSGCGFDPEFLPNLFRPFWQAEAGASRRTSGLGLGSPSSAT